MRKLHAEMSSADSMAVRCGHRSSVDTLRDSSITAATRFSVSSETGRLTRGVF